jgi:hypothetical protein
MVEEKSCRCVSGFFEGRNDVGQLVKVMVSTTRDQNLERKPKKGGESVRRN